MCIISPYSGFLLPFFLSITWKWMFKTIPTGLLEESVLEVILAIRPLQYTALNHLVHMNYLHGTQCLWSNSHLCLAGCAVMVMVSWDIVQLLHCVVSPGGKCLALGWGLVHTQGVVQVIWGTGMGVHLSHPVAIQDRCWNKDIWVGQGSWHRLLSKTWVFWRKQRVLGMKTLSRQQLFIWEDLLIRHTEVLRHDSLWGQHPVLGHGPHYTAWPVPLADLFLG